VDGLLHRLDDFACQPPCTVACGDVFFDLGDGDTLDEDGDALHWLVAERAVVCRKLETVDDLVAEVVGLKLFIPGRGCLLMGLILVGGECLGEVAVFGGVDEQVWTGPSRSEGDDLVDHTLPTITVFAGVELGLEFSFEFLGRKDLGNL
jgi:hypothetical protein